MNTAEYPTLFGDVAPMQPANVMDLRDVTPFTDELARELRRAAAIRRNPFYGEYDARRPPKRLTFADVARRLRWTARPVYENPAERWAGEQWENCTEWLNSRRQLLGLTTEVAP